MSLADFRADHLAPAQKRCADLQANQVEAEAELARLLGSVDYDDQVAAELQTRIETLRADHARWERRVSALSSRDTGQQGGSVNV